MIIPPWLNPTILAGAALVAAVVIQTMRLNHVQTALAEQKTIQANLVADVATARADGLESGLKLQKAAQAVIDAKREEITTGLLLDAAKREQAQQARATHLAQLLADGRWLCLREPLPEPVLEEYRR